MKKVGSQTGLAVIKLLVAVLVACAILITGFLIWHNNRNTAQSSAKVQQQVSVVTSHDSMQAEQKVQAAFHAYIGAGVDLDARLAAVKPYVTEVSYESLQGTQEHDPLLCAQTMPDSFTTASRKTSKSIDVYVTEKFGKSSEVVLASVDSTTLQIMSISCTY